MIGKLKGTVDEIGEDHAVIDVHGVGYVAFCPMRTLSGLREGEAAVLHIETYVREDMIRLYGFATHLEREWFRLLQSVQGVGAKVALAVLGVLSTQDLANAVALGNWAAVEQAPGVGKKLAQRIVTELKDKAPALAVAGLANKAGGATEQGGGGRGDGPVAGMAAAEAISALTNLGYNPAQASQAVAVAMGDLGTDADTAKLIRRGLKELSR